MSDADNCPPGSDDQSETLKRFRMCAFCRKAITDRYDLFDNKAYHRGCLDRRLRKRPKER